MGRDDVPAERVEAELGKRPPDDRRRRFGRARAAQLPFRCERDPGDTRAAVARGLAHEQELGLVVRPQVRLQPHAAQGSSASVAVEVERPPDARCGESCDEPSCVHSVTMLMSVRGRVAVLAAACAGVCVAGANAATPPQGFQPDAAFAASYERQNVVSVPATTQRVSCYAPEVLYQGSLPPSQGYPDGGSTPCLGTASTGELLGPYPTQDVANPPLRVKDFSESDIHVDPTNARHLIAVSKWIVNVESYNHLAGLFESYDGGRTWPQQGHIPGYEGWTDNSDPAGAFDPWGNFYAVMLPYTFGYLRDGEHFFGSPDVNPQLFTRSGVGVAVRPRGAATPASWIATRGGAPDLVARTPFNGSSLFDRPWIVIDTTRPSRHFGRVYVSWAIGTSDRGLRV